MTDTCVSWLRTSDADPATLIAAWQGAIDSIAALGDTLDSDGWNAPTDCAGWTVADIVAHVIGIEAELAGRQDPPHQPDWSRLPHVGNDFGRYTEVPVDLRRGRAKPELLQELREVTAIRAAQLAEGPLSPTAEVTGPAGMRITLDRLLRMRAFDVWVHLQDIRHAVNRPGDLATAAAWVSAVQLLRALPFVLGKTLGAAQGDSLRVDVSGPVRFACTAQVGADGRARFVAASELRGEPGTIGGPSALLRTDWVTYERLGCGRLDVTEPAVHERVELLGDIGITSRLLPAMAIAP